MVLVLSFKLSLAKFNVKSLFPTNSDVLTTCSLPRSAPLRPISAGLHIPVELLRVQSAWSASASTDRSTARSAALSCHSAGPTPFCTQRSNTRNTVTTAGRRQSTARQTHCSTRPASCNDVLNLPSQKDFSFVTPISAYPVGTKI